MSRKVSISILLLVALLIGGSIYIFLQTHERKQRTIHTGLFGEARSNPLYASRLFLKRMGIPAETKSNIQSFAGFPSTDTVLLINSKRSHMSPRRTQELIDWVKRGGHVIALATHNWRYQGSHKKDSEGFEEALHLENSNHSPDPLQRFLGLKTDRKITYNDLNELEQTQVDKIEEDGDDYKFDTLFKINLKGVDKELRIANSWYNPILVEKTPQQAHTEREVIQLRSSNFIIRQKVENGLVTLISSMQFFENKQIEKADHAEILWHLIHGKHPSLNQPKAVWLIHSDQIPSLLNILWRNAWALIISLSLLFLAWLLASTRRFGPMIAKQEDDRRSLNEHISNSGNFYWKNKDHQKLLDSARSTLMQKLSRIYPNWTHLNQEEQLKMLAEKSGLTLAEIHKTLFSQASEKADDFTQSIRQLEKIKHAL